MELAEDVVKVSVEAESVVSVVLVLPVVVSETVSVVCVIVETENVDCDVVVDVTLVVMVFVVVERVLDDSVVWVTVVQKPHCLSHMPTYAPMQVEQKMVSHASLQASPVHEALQNSSPLMLMRSQVAVDVSLDSVEVLTDMDDNVVVAVAVDRVVALVLESDVDETEVVD